MSENSTQHDAKVAVGFTSGNKPYLRLGLRDSSSAITQAVASVIVAGPLGGHILLVRSLGGNVCCVRNLVAFLSQ